MSLVLQIGFKLEFKEHGSWYSAFIQNLIMSVLYLKMLGDRKSAKGQSLLIAICKGLGTLAPTILFGLVFGNNLVLLLGIFCAVFDTIYVVLLGRQIKRDRVQA